jgi:hypothetical protein
VIANNFTGNFYSTEEAYGAQQGEKADFLLLGKQEDFSISSNNWIIQILNQTPLFEARLHPQV